MPAGAEFVWRQITLLRTAEAQILHTMKQSSHHLLLWYTACCAVQTFFSSPGAAEAAVPIEGHIFSRAGSEVQPLNCRPADGAEMDRDDYSRSVVECSNSCLQAEDCKAAAFSQQEGVCLLYRQAWNSGQCAVAGDWDVVVKGEINRTECMNGGNPKTDGSGCQCYEGYVGAKCEKLTEDCHELKLSGQYPDVNLKFFWVQPLLMEQPVRVLCLSNGYTIFQKRLRSSVNFNRTWQEYVDGFGLGTHDFWLGLQNLYLFTNSRPYNLGLYMYFENDDRYFLYYEDFRLTENIKYTATLGRFLKGDIDGNLEEKMNMTAFSTYDNDNDNNSTVNCGLLYGGGWWFDDCVDEVNFNGRLTKTGNWTSANEVHYPGISGNRAPKSVSLRLVRP